MIILVTTGGYFYKLTIEAQKSDHPHYGIGSAVLYKGKLISKGYNQKKTNPRLVRFGYYDGVIHSECASIMKASKGDTLVVIRVRKDGTLSCSKPCKRCLAFAKDFGIKTVIYSDWQSNLREIKI